MGEVFKIADRVIGSIPVLVINLASLRLLAQKRLGYEHMNEHHPTAADVA